MVEMDSLMSRKKGIYIIKNFSLRLSLGVTKPSLVPTTCQASVSIVMCSLGLKLEFSQSCKSHKGPKKMYIFFTSRRRFNF